ncbi:ABC transporter domain-containing protein [Ditylenchus destructor]|uniref:ABC transporter domain-containing protein n=1 Tax=Ditylenchus destructor TaxID=166010 RepID=A0AAD4MIS7_9BILA|nr:ABC transporter domain-containing protein [Ditylenchus destructor]
MSACATDGAETLSDVSFTLSAGSFYFVTGASGAGKTSLLRLLYLAQRPTRGIVRLFGEDAGALPRKRLPGFRRRIGGSRFRQAADAVGRRAAAHRDRACRHHPAEILIADEPTGNVDPDMAERLLHLFDSLNRLGTTVVVATHDFQLISRIPDARMMRIEKGRLNDPTGALRYPPGQAPA